MKGKDSSAAHQYAQAILQIAAQVTDGNNDMLEKIAENLEIINQAINSSSDLKLLLSHPSIPNADKKQLLTTLFAKRIDDLALRLIELLTDKRRLALLPQIETQYKLLLNKLKHIVTAKLISADPLSQPAVADIKARLTEHVGKRLELEVATDPSLIGGFVLRLGDQVIDGSLKGKLQSIEKVLLAV